MKRSTFPSFPRSGKCWRIHGYGHIEQPTNDLISYYMKWYWDWGTRQKCPDFDQWISFLGKYGAMHIPLLFINPFCSTLTTELRDVLLNTGALNQHRLFCQSTWSQRSRTHGFKYSDLGLSWCFQITLLDGGSSLLCALGLLSTICVMYAIYYIGPLLWRCGQSW